MLLYSFGASASCQRSSCGPRLERLLYGRRGFRACHTGAKLVAILPGKLLRSIRVAQPREIAPEEPRRLFRSWFALNSWVDVGHERTISSPWWLSSWSCPCPCYRSLDLLPLASPAVLRIPCCASLEPWARCACS